MTKRRSGHRIDDVVGGGIQGIPTITVRTVWYRPWTTAATAAAQAGPGRTCRAWRSLDTGDDY